MCPMAHCMGPWVEALPEALDLPVSALGSLSEHWITETGTPGSQIIGPTAAGGLVWHSRAACYGLLRFCFASGSHFICFYLSRNDYHSYPHLLY